GVTVIDLDVKNGVDGDATWSHLRATHGDVPITRTVLTPSGGRHLYFLTRYLAIHSSVGRLGPGIDVRSDGGYVVGAGVIDGVAYMTLPHPMAPAPDWLVVLLQASDRGMRAGRSPSEWSALARGGVGAGQRNATVTAFAGHLLRKGVHEGVVIELLCAWNDARCTPPLSRTEVIRCVRSIASRELRRQGVAR
ncbi:MAG TPA: bifunctional DNA primase/polymerase, partial [Candidatus Dormibacteraeota bacterium]